MISLTANYSGKITTQGRECFVGDQKVDCPQSPISQYTQSGDKLDILSSNFLPDSRNDLVFFWLFSALIAIFFTLGFTKAKVFGKTLAEYLVPIWPYILISILAVISQYTLVPQFPFLLRPSQVLWELMVGLSAYKFYRQGNFTYANMFFLGIFFSFIIHGLKVTIRYLFYAKSLLYVADRFIYGTILVMLVSFVLGSLLIFCRQQGWLKS